MADGSSIEWTEATWNPVVGCTRVSAGCDHCYAVRQSYRLERMGKEKYRGLTVLNERGDRHFSGAVRCDKSALSIPFRWKKPRRVFVNSMSDLFHRDVPFPFIASVFTTMAQTPHTYQVLTKRPERLREFYSWNYPFGSAPSAMAEKDWLCSWPNVWLGTSVENQETADERIPHLLDTPAAVRFLSIEPLLGPIELLWLAGIHWVIVGGESGPGARPMQLPWAWSIVEQCRAAGVACFVKQLGSWAGGKRHHDMDTFPESLRVREYPDGP